MRNKDGDQNKDTYSIDKSADNFIEVQYYNASTKELKGIFQMKLVREGIGKVASISYNPRPDTLYITNGIFDVLNFQRDLP